MRQIKWQEPASFIRALKRHTKQGINRKRQLILFLAVAGGLTLIFVGATLIGYFRHGFKEGFGLMWVLFTIPFGVAFVIAYFIPWISSLTNAQIAVSETGVYRTNREGTILVFRRWLWQTIQGCRIETVVLDETPYRALVLSLHNGETVPIGLSEKLDIDQLEELLRFVGKGSS